MPARIRRRPRRKRLVKKNPRLRFIWAFVFLVLILLIINLTTRFWSNTAKLSLVATKEDGGVVVVVFDPLVEKITSIEFPGNTQVEVARQLGTWKMSSLWQLGKNEDLEGKLLAETLVYHFRLPVYIWGDNPVGKFSERNPFLIVSAVFSPYSTNLGFGDRLRLGFFALGVKNFKRENIDLARLGYLRKTVLIDGEEGYILPASLPGSVVAIFADPEVSKLQTKVQIIDRTSRPGVAKRVGEVLEAFGAKTALIKDEGEQDSDCLISGRNKETVKKISLLFSCDKEKIYEEGNFDLKVELGEEFARRF